MLLVTGYRGFWLNCGLRHLMYLQVRRQRCCGRRRRHLTPATFCRLTTDPLTLVSSSQSAGTRWRAPGGWRVSPTPSPQRTLDASPCCASLRVFLAFRAVVTLIPHAQRGPRLQHCLLPAGHHAHFPGRGTHLRETAIGGEPARGACAFLSASTRVSDGARRSSS